MALLFCDGFGHYATADMLKKWTQFSGAGQTIHATNGRRAGPCMEITTAASGIQKTLPAAKATLIVGAAIRLALYSGSPLFKFLDGATEQINVLANADGTLQVRRGTSAGTLLGTSKPALYNNNIWQYVEAKVTFADTTGAVEIRVDGVTVLTLTNIDTANTVNFSATAVGLHAPGANVDLDDFYVCDSLGTAQNNFLGDVRIDTLFPNAAGTYTQFTPNTAVANYTTVDEAVATVTDWNATATVGHKDSYALQDHPLAAANIKGAQLNAYMMKGDAGSRQAATLLKNGASEVVGAGVGLVETPGAILSTPHDVAPGGAAWTVALVNSTEAGVTVTA